MEQAQILPGVNRRALQRRIDSRGWLLKLLMRQHIDGGREFGEIYLTAAHRGQVKGNHVHAQTREWFCVIEGKASLALRVMTTGEQAVVDLDAQRPEVIEVAPGVAHAFKNNHPAMMVLLAYADTPYDARQPDEQRVALLQNDAPPEAGGPVGV